MKLSGLLEELSKQGYTLKYFPDFGGLTIGGAIATGSFASSLSDSSSLHDQVVGITIARGTGEVVVLGKSHLNAAKTSLGNPITNFPLVEQRERKKCWEKKM